MKICYLPYFTFKIFLDFWVFTYKKNVFKNQCIRHKSISSFPFLLCLPPFANQKPTYSGNDVHRMTHRGVWFWPFLLPLLILLLALDCNCMASSTWIEALQDVSSVALIHRHPATLLLFTAKLGRAPHQWKCSGWTQRTLRRARLVSETLVGLGR